MRTLPSPGIQTGFRLLVESKNIPVRDIFTPLYFSIVVDTLPEIWNQLEAYVFDACGLIRNANLLGNGREAGAL